MSLATIATRDSVPATPTGATMSLVQWAEEASAAHRLAEGLCATSFVPEAWRGKPVEGAAAILAGSEIGLSPMASLNAFDSIQGRATPRAITLRAAVQSRGHQISVIESTEARCVIRGRRKGETEWQESVWTIQRAQKLKLTGKPNWQQQPQAMLLARATAEICRMIAADAILGIPYAAEEVTDEIVEAKAPGVTTVRRAQRQAPVEPATVTVVPESASPAGPPLPGEDDPEDAPPADTITDAQMRKLRAQLGELGIGAKDDRDTVLALVSSIVGRDVPSSKDLSKGEASGLIDALEQDGAVLLAQVLDGVQP